MRCVSKNCIQKRLREQKKQREKGHVHVQCLGDRLGKILQILLHPQNYNARFRYLRKLEAKISLSETDETTSTQKKKVNLIEINYFPKVKTSSIWFISLHIVNL